MLDVCPSCNNGAENHEAEREEGHSRDTAASKPQHLSVGGDNNGHVLEDSVDRDRKVLEGLGSGIDQCNEEQRDREPFSAISIASILCAMEHIHFLASSSLKSR